MSNKTRAERLFDSAVEGLTDYYPELKNADYLAAIKNVVKVPDTGNDQADYEEARNDIERQAQNLLIDGRTL